MGMLSHHLVSFVEGMSIIAFFTFRLQSYDYSP